MGLCNIHCNHTGAQRHKWQLPKLSSISCPNSVNLSLFSDLRTIITKYRKTPCKLRICCNSKGLLRGKLVYLSSVPKTVQLGVREKNRENREESEEKLVAKFLKDNASIVFQKFKYFSAQCLKLFKNQTKTQTKKKETPKRKSEPGTVSNISLLTSETASSQLYWSHNPTPTPNTPLLHTHPRSPPTYTRTPPKSPRLRRLYSHWISPCQRQLHPTPITL